MEQKKNSPQQEPSASKTAMDKFILDVDKKYGKGVLIDAGTSKVIDKVECIGTGSLGLDVILGIGGYPEGRIIEIFGAESSGKTTLAIHAAVEAQAKHKGKYVGFIDMEHALDLMYARSIGVDTERFAISQPDYGEQALDIAEDMISSGLFSLVVIDSVAALVPKSELDGEMGDAHVGQHARLMSQAMRKLTSKISKSGVVVIFINQQREKIGVMFGSPLVTTGGNALKFYASVRIEVSRVGQNKDGDVVTGNKTKVKTVKNKMASPFKLCTFDIVFGKGISKIGEIVDYGSDLGILTKSGSWYAYHETKLGQGRDSVVELLNQNPDLVDELETQIKAKMGTLEFEVKQ